MEECRHLVPSHLIAGATSDGLEPFDSNVNTALPLPSGIRADYLDSQSRSIALGKFEDLLFGDSLNAKRWLSRLDGGKASIAKRLRKHETLGKVLLKVLNIPGQRQGFKLGIWRKILIARDDEEVMHYLMHIYITFVRIMGSEDSLKFVDDRAVKEFELRAPGLSRCDGAHVSLAVQSNMVLKGLADEPARVQVVSTWKYKLLDSIALHSSERLLLSEAMVRRYESVDFRQARFSDYDQNHGQECVYIARGPTLLRFRFGIPQQLLNLDGEEKPEARQYDEGAWHQLALRARELGFCSDEISRLCSVNPDREAATKFLLTARPPQYFEYGQNFNDLVDLVVQVFDEARLVQKEVSNPTFTIKQLGEPVARRCGRQYSKAYARDRPFLTPQWFTCKTEKNFDVTLFIRAALYLQRILGLRMAGVSTMGEVHA
ncbi:uncharacterized protein VDAG_04902 [Verticillium dahliae VdLs.17]|uniref:Uncharacterized protein n=1 Tax=Verticillium dahliae (strain VdLs.17 / ATCC MYA-4575 / FGSC 10137) TaxID=498257 RepID=G2X3B7_VERDV|nr:uncharacterized protein VDAG_04902 [Verticillium dahliae VdLs.17]EGY23464.1 hypothetical protein VDAG_04902 [Verticillium dahliae VdLs.17]KAH6708526.1 hypothetical protein EV126DRAFT_377103 [Verticillium dahliae]